MTPPHSIPVSAIHLARAVVENIGTVLRGKREVAELSVTALLAGGHLLVEDVPGVGKTTLARALAQSLGVEFRRLQFTNDLMPTDVLGGNVLNPATGDFEFRAGPVFTQVLLADEINRTPPRTQSALLEAMDEGRVSVDGVTRILERPFFVVATQNPEEFHGTYPLPESQLDRFLLRLSIGYPSPEVEAEIIRTRRVLDPTERMEQVAGREELLSAQRAVDEVRAEAEVVDYLHGLVLATRSHSQLSLGASTRAVISFERTVRAYALVQGRAYATPDDVQALAVASLAHRVRVAGASEGSASRVGAEQVIQEILEQHPVPV